MSNATYKQDLHDIAIAVANNCKKYIDKVADDLRWELGTYDLSADSDTTTAYQKVVPANSIEAKVNTLGGMSYKVNQLYNVTRNTTTFDINCNCVNGVVSITGTSNGTGNGASFAWTDFTAINGHKFLITKDFDLPTDWFIFDQYNVNDTTNIINTIFTVTAGFIIPQLKVATNGTTVNITNGHLMVFDLTAMEIDTTSLDTAIAGLLARGINPYEYNAYDSGSIRDTAITNVKSVGVNNCDEQFEFGIFNTIDGSDIATSNQIRTKNNLPVLPNTTYYLHIYKNVASWVLFLDTNGNVISNWDSSNVPSYYRDGNAFAIIGSGLFTTPSNCRYIKFYLVAEYGNIYLNDIMLNIGSSALPYKPYFTASLLIPAQVQALDGYGKSIVGTNVSNTLDFNSKKFIKYRGDVDLGTLGWFKDTTTRPADGATINAWYAQLNECVMTTSVANMFLDGYTVDTVQNVDYGGYYQVLDKLIGGADGNHRIWLYNSAYQNMTQQELQAELSGKILQFELATPVETDISAYLTTNKITVEGGGTLTAENTYGASVPSDIDYLIEEVKA